MGIRFRNLTLGLTLLLVLLCGAHPTRVQGAGIDLAGTLREGEAAGVHPATLNRLLALGYEHAFDPAQVEKLLRVLIATQKEGFPPQPFVSKIEEGIAKGVAPARIVQVLEKKLDDYRFSRSLIASRPEGRESQGTRVSMEYHVRLAELLNAGLTREDLRQLSVSAPTAPLPVLIRSAELLASLKQVRFDDGLAAQIVSSGLQRNYFTAEQADFGRILSTARSKGTPDEEITAAALAVIQSNAPASRLSSLLSVSTADLGARGPQVGGSRAGTGVGGPGSGHGPGGPSGAGHGGPGGSAGGGSGSGGGGGGGGGGGR